MSVLRALAGLHDLVELLQGLRLGRFQLADLAADWLTDGRTTRDRHRVAELEAHVARLADPLAQVIADTTMPEQLRAAAATEWTRRRDAAFASSTHEGTDR